MAVNNACNEVPTISGTTNQISVSTVGTNVTLSLSPTLVNPTQPLFSAHVNPSTAPITGDGTDAKIVFNVVDVNQTGAYNASTGVFTAPVTGNYLVGCAVTVDWDGGVNPSDITITLVGSLKSYLIAYNPAPASDASVSMQFVYAGQAIIPLTTGATISTHILCNGFNLSVYVDGGSGSLDTSYFYAYLLP
jgi:hypothetical protein